MGKIHQIGEEFYIEFTARGLVYHQKVGNDFVKAQELLDGIEEKIFAGEMLLQPRQIDLDIFYVEYIKFVQMQYHPLTVHRLKLTIDHFNQFIQRHYPRVTQLSHINPRVIEDYKNYGIKLRQAKQTIVNPKVINLTLILLKEILDYGIKTGFIQDNPVTHIKPLAIKPTGKHVLSVDQCRKIFEQIDVFYQPMYSFIRYTGLRPQELITLSWRHVDFNRQVICVGIREVPLMVPAIRIIESLNAKVIDNKAVVFQGPRGERLGVNQLNAIFDEACKKAGVEPACSIMDLRQIFIIRLLEKRVPLLLIGKMAGVFDVAKLMRFSAHIVLNEPERQS